VSRPISRRSTIRSCATTALRLARDRLAEHRVAGFSPSEWSFQPRSAALRTAGSCPCCRVPTVPGPRGARCVKAPPRAHRYSAGAIMPPGSAYRRGRSSALAPRRGANGPQQLRLYPFGLLLHPADQHRGGSRVAPQRDGAYRRRADGTLSSLSAGIAGRAISRPPGLGSPSSAASRTNSDGWRSNGTSSVTAWGLPVKPTNPLPPRTTWDPGPRACPAAARGPDPPPCDGSPVGARRSTGAAMNASRTSPMESDANAATAHQRLPLLGRHARLPEAGAPSAPPRRAREPRAPPGRSLRQLRIPLPSAAGGRAPQSRPPQWPRRAAPTTGERARRACQRAADWSSGVVAWRARHARFTSISTGRTSGRTRRWAVFPPQRVRRRGGRLLRRGGGRGTRCGRRLRDRRRTAPGVGVRSFSSLADVRRPRVRVMRPSVPSSGGTVLVAT